MCADHVESEPAIIVEFEPRPGVQQVSMSPEDIARQSAEALDRAMATVKGMSVRFEETVKALAVPPSSTELQFGLKLDASVGAFVAKASAEAAINVKLTWNRDDRPSP